MKMPFVRARHAWMCSLAVLAMAGCGGGTESAAPAERALPQAASAVQERDSPSAASTVSPVYRFAKISNGAYFYTGSEEERNIILREYPDFRFEGVGFNRTADDSGRPVYRFANLVNGGYFYTADEAERQLVVNTRPDMRFEGSTFKVADGSFTAPEPVYRLANLQNGAYLYTRSTEEVNAAVGTGIWRAEGVVFQAPAGTSVVPVTITASPLSYSKITSVTVTGAALTASDVLTIPNCANLSEVAGGSTQVRRFSCQVLATGGLNAELRSVAGQSVASAVLSVPEPRVSMVTSKGTILLELNPTKAPNTVYNFLRYVNDGFYANTLFHRVIGNFVVQGGGFQSGLVFKQPTYTAIKLESNVGLSNVRGSIAMARTNAADSATSQFFINVANNTSLDYQSAASPGYAVFGTVVQGLDVVDAIRVVPTGTVSGTADVPLTEVMIQSATQVR